MHRSEWKASFATLTQDRKLGVEEEGVSLEDLLETQRSNITKIKTTLLWWHSKTWLYALTYTKTRSSHTNALNAKLYDFFLKWILALVSCQVETEKLKLHWFLKPQASTESWPRCQAHFHKYSIWNSGNMSFTRCSLTVTPVEQPPMWAERLTGK